MNNFKENSLNQYRESKNATKSETIADVYNNYHVTLDRNSCSFYIQINAEYDEAYDIIVRWFSRERYEGRFKTIGSFIKSHGFNTIEKGNDSNKGIYINLNNIRFH